MILYADLMRGGGRQARQGEIMVAHGCRKRKKLICGTEGEIVMAHGRLPSPLLRETHRISLFNVALKSRLRFRIFYQLTEIS